MRKPDEFQEETELTTETKAKITATLERLKEDGIDLYGCDYVDVNDMAYIYHATHYLLRYVEGLRATIAGMDIAEMALCRRIKNLEAENEKLQWYCDAEVDRAAEAHYNMREAKASVPRWIPVDERLPEKHRIVLAYFRFGMIDTGIYNGRNWWNDIGIANNENVTHWMPLPEPPEEVHHD